MTTQECQELIRTAIRRGMAKAAPVRTAQPIDQIRMRHRVYERNKRQLWLSQGLTTEGKVRQRNYQFLTGMTEEQKQARLDAQKQAWRERQKQCQSNQPTTS